MAFGELGDVIISVRVFNQIFDDMVLGFNSEEAVDDSATHFAYTV